MFKLKAILLATLSVVAVTSVQASGPVTSLTRESVVAEFQRARAAGELTIVSPGELTVHSTPSATPSTLTRADVQAEYRRARNAGEIRLGNASASEMPQGMSTLTRADVVREYQRARNAGELAEANATDNSPLSRRTVQ